MNMLVLSRYEYVVDLIKRYNLIYFYNFSVLFSVVDYKTKIFQFFVLFFVLFFRIISIPSVFICSFFWIIKLFFYKYSIDYTDNRLSYWYHNINYLPSFFDLLVELLIKYPIKFGYMIAYKIMKLLYGSRGSISWAIFVELSFFIVVGISLRNINIAYHLTLCLIIEDNKIDIYYLIFFPGLVLNCLYTRINFIDPLSLRIYKVN